MQLCRCCESFQRLFCGFSFPRVWNRVNGFAQHKSQLVTSLMSFFHEFSRAVSVLNDYAQAEDAMW